jgi:hypothetical protein
MTDALVRPKENPGAMLRVMDSLDAVVRAGFRGTWPFLLRCSICCQQHTLEQKMTALNSTGMTGAAPLA